MPLMADQAAPNQPFGTYLRDLRRARRLTLREVEEKSGVSNSYLSQVENGRILQPSPHVLQKLGEAYEVPYEHLMARAGYIRPAAAPSAPAPGVHEAPGAYEAATDSSARPGWAFSIPDDLSADEEIELQNFLDYLRFRRGQKNNEP
jgi:HTH-type transcriptional regulator, competence development regulator